VPAVYQLIRESGDRPGRLLELPTGIRDGTSSLGDFSASSAFFQTVHGLPLIGGYVSRVSEWRKRESLRIPVLESLIDLSEGRMISPEQVAAARASSRAFLARSCLAYVVVDKRRSSQLLQDFAIDVLNLSLVHEDADRALFEPRDRPGCSPLPRRLHTNRKKPTSGRPPGGAAGSR
jgi:hypothetical protein